MAWRCAVALSTYSWRVIFVVTVLSNSVARDFVDIVNPLRAFSAYVTVTLDAPVYFAISVDGRGERLNLVAEVAYSAIT